MLARFAGIATACSFLTCPAVWAQAPGGESISASGEAKVLRGDAAEAQNEAVTAAMEAVVEQTAASLLPTEFANRNRDLLRNRVAESPRRFIQDYKLANSAQTGDTLTVEVKGVPRKDKIREELVRWGILFDRASRPRLQVMTLQEQPDRSSPKHVPAPRWTSLLARRLRGLGYVVDEGRGPGSSARKESEAQAHDVSVWGTVAPEGKGLLRINLQAALEKPYTKLIAAQERLNLEDGDETAAGMMATAFLEKLLPAWFVQTGEGRLFELAVEGLRSNPPYKALLEALNSGKGGFSSGVEKIYRTGSVTFDVVFDGSAKDLAEAVVKLPLPVKLRVIEVRGTSLRLAVK